MRALACASVSSILVRSEGLIGAPIRWRIGAAALASLTTTSSRRWQPAQQDSRSSSERSTPAALLREMSHYSGRVVVGRDLDVY